MEANLEAFTISEILINEDSTQGDYYSLRGLAYFQRAQLQNNAKEIMEKSKQDLIRATKYNNINLSQCHRSGMLSTKFLGNLSLEKSPLLFSGLEQGGIFQNRPKVKKIKLTNALKHPKTRFLSKFGPPQAFF